jgi:hypothetical protein
MQVQDRNGREIKLIADVIEICARCGYEAWRPHYPCNRCGGLESRRYLAEDVLAGALADRPDVRAVIARLLAEGR